MSKKPSRLRAADRKLRAFFRNIPKKIKQIPERVKLYWEVFQYLLKHPKEIVRLLPSKQKVKRFFKKLGKASLALVLVLIITGSLVACGFVIYVVNNFDGTTGLPDLNNLSMDATSIIWVKNDKTNQWEEYQHLEGVNSMWVDMEEIPRHMQLAVVAIEDERFESHYGIDWKRTVAAFANSVLHFNDVEFGGSTITQQLIKVTTGDKEHNWTRKITEILRAVEMEKLYDKDQILEAYLNNLPLSNNVVGVGAGAQYFFGKDVQELTIAESAVLASITNNPSRYNPYTRPQNVKNRQMMVLKKMNELGFITDDEYVQAAGEELQYKSIIKHTATWDYYVDLVIEDVIADLQDQYGYTEQYATQMVFYGGLNIYSAEKPSQQKAVEEIYANEKNYPAIRQNDTQNPEAALFVMDYDGRVVATIGGRGQKEGKRDFNRSTKAYRSPGSSIKPISAYGPAVALDVVHWSTVMRDAPVITLPGGNPWPANYESKPKDNGNTFVYLGLEKSLNTIAAGLIEKLTPKTSFDYATSIFKLSSLVKSQPTTNGQVLTDIDRAPLALGALTKGVSSRDMAAAFQVFGNGGYYNQPYTYYEVYQNGTKEENGKLLLSDGPQNIRVMDESSAYVMNRMMQRVVQYGTAANIGKDWAGWEVYGKTGTAESKRDVYFCGGTPYFVGASWFGYDNNQTLISTQTGYARTLWSKAMKALHKDLEVKAFEKKGDTKELAFCTESGEIATDLCPNTDVGVYKESNTPGLCQVHAGSPKTTTAEGQTEGTTTADGQTGTTTQGVTTTQSGATTTTTATENTQAE